MSDVPVQSVTVVICAYTLDRWADIVAAVDGIGSQTVPPTELVLVSDHNPELAARAQAEFSSKTLPVRILENAHEQGLSGARNTVIDQCSSDIIMFLDDDARPMQTWLEKLLEPFSDDDVWVTGGRSVPSWPAERPAWFPEEFDWVVGSSHRGVPTQTAPVRNVIGCSMAFRRSVFELIGGFVEGIGRVGLLPQGCEETELCIRLRQAQPSVKVMFVPDSVVAHRVSEPRTKLKYFRSRCLAEGVSKAQISALVGASDGTASERDYVAHVLPAGVIRYLGQALRGDLNGLRRAAAIVLGLSLTVWGYVRTNARQRIKARKKK